MTDDELVEIEERNRRRRELRASTTPGPWLYDSFGCVTADFDGQLGRPLRPRSRLMLTVVRPMQWWEVFFELHGRGILDEGLDPAEQQPYYDAEWIAESHEDVVEDDIAALVQEVRRLRSRVEHA